MLATGSSINRVGVACSYSSFFFHGLLIIIIYTYNIIIYFFKDGLNNKAERKGLGTCLYCTCTEWNAEVRWGLLALS